jgi:hypothetical protein
MGGVCSLHGEVINAYKVWLEILKGRDNWEDLGVDGRMISNCILGI